MSEIFKHLDEIHSWFKQIEVLIKETESLDIDTKLNERDLVTNVDIAVQNLLEENILKLTPNAQILGEEKEAGEINSNADQLWIIDPIDGTANFVKQRRDYGTLLAYFEKGEPVLSFIYDIYHGELYEARLGQGLFLNGEEFEKPKDKSLNKSLAIMLPREFKDHKAYPKILEEAFDIRYYGASSIDGLAVVQGRAGVFVNPLGQPWDYAPYFLFAKEAGLHFSNIYGGKVELLKPNGFIIATKSCWEDIKEYF